MSSWKGSSHLLLLLVCVFVAAAYDSADMEDQESMYQKALTALRSLIESRAEKSSSAAASENAIETGGKANVQKRGWKIRIRLRLRVKIDYNKRRLRRKGADEEDTNDDNVENDDIAFDDENRLVMNIITGAGGKEVTISDYNKGILAVMTPDDKMCRLHEMSADDRNVDLKKEEEILQVISEGKEEPDTSLDKEVDYKESNRPVKEEELGEKIPEYCNKKSYEMIWMKAVETNDQDSDGDEQDIEKTLDSVLDGKEKRGLCVFGRRWTCIWICVNKFNRWGRCLVKRPRCSYRKCSSSWRRR